MIYPKRIITHRKTSFSTYLTSIPFEAFTQTNKNLLCRTNVRQKSAMSHNSHAKHPSLCCYGRRVQLFATRLLPRGHRRIAGRDPSHEDHSKRVVSTHSPRRRLRLTFELQTTFEVRYQFGGYGQGTSVQYLRRLHVGTDDDEQRPSGPVGLSKCFERYLDRVCRERDGLRLECRAYYISHARTWGAA